MKRLAVPLALISLALGAWLHALPDASPAGSATSAAAPAPGGLAARGGIIAASDGRTQAVAPGQTAIPASFMGGPRQELLSFEDACKRVAADPQLLLTPNAFSSQVWRAVPSSFGIKPSDVVLDIGCGTGALEFHLLRGGVRFSHLYAIDVNQRSLDFLDFALARCTDPEARKVKTLLSSCGSVGLPREVADVAIIYNTPIGATPPKSQVPQVNEIDKVFMMSLFEVMRPGGRVHFTLFGEEHVFGTVRGAFESCGFQTVQESKGGPGTISYLSLVLERPKR